MLRRLARRPSGKRILDPSRCLLCTRCRFSFSSRPRDDLSLRCVHPAGLSSERTLPSWLEISDKLLGRQRSEADYPARRAQQSAGFTYAPQTWLRADAEDSTRTDPGASPHELPRRIESRLHVPTYHTTRPLLPNLRIRELESGPRTTVCKACHLGFLSPKRRPQCAHLAEDPEIKPIFVGGRASYAAISKAKKAAHPCP